jgi:hypothetical protein
MSESDIPGIPRDGLERERLPDDAIALIDDWARYRTRKRSDIFDDVAQEAKARASRPEELAMIRFYRKENLETVPFQLAEQRLLTVVDSSYDAVTRRKRKGYQREKGGTTLGGLEDRPGLDVAFWLDVDDAFKSLTDEEVLVIEMRASGMSYPEIQAELRQIDIECEYTIDEVRGINRRAQKKLRRSLRAYQPERRRGQLKEDRPPVV